MNVYVVHNKYLDMKVVVMAPSREHAIAVLKEKISGDLIGYHRVSTSIGSWSNKAMTTADQFSTDRYLPKVIGVLKD